MNICAFVLALVVLGGAILAFCVAWRIHKIDRQVKDEKERLEKERRRKISDR